MHVTIARASKIETIETAMVNPRTVPDWSLWSSSAWAVAILIEGIDNEKVGAASEGCCTRARVIVFTAALVRAGYDIVGRCSGEKAVAGPLVEAKGL